MNDMIPANTPSPTKLLPRSRAILALAIFVHLSFLLSWRLGYWNRFTFDSVATQGYRGWDFYALYQAGHNVLTDVSIYESDNDKIDVVAPRYTPYRYLPFPAYTLGLALNLLSPLWAFRLWMIVVESTLLACAYASYRRSRDPEQGAVLAAMWLCYTPYYLEIYLGQFSLVQAALILAMISSAERPSWVHDLSWVASLLWKQNTALFAPLLLRLGRWRALIVAGLVVSLTTFPYLLRYPTAVRALADNLVSGPPSHQLGNLGVRQFLYGLGSALAPGMTPRTHGYLQSVWVLLVLGAALAITFRDPRPDPAWHLCLWTTTYFLVYHQVWEHHYVMLLPIYVFLYARKRSAWLGFLYVATAIWTPYILIDPTGWAGWHAPMRWTPLEPRIVDVLYHASKAVPALALWTYIVVRIRAIWPAASAARP